VADEDPAALDGIERWAAEARAREAAEARVRERWLRTQAEEDARFSSVLANLAEHGASARLGTTWGRELHGRLTAVGEDFVAVCAAAGGVVLIRLSALAWVRPTAERRRRPDVPLGSAVEDDMALTEGAALVDVLAHVAASRPRVSVSAGASTLVGELRAVGADLLVVETEGEHATLVYVPLPSVTYVSLLTSG
jgi:hypothetical protein